MSIERCFVHDRDWDSDFLEECPACRANGIWRPMEASACEAIAILRDAADDTNLVHSPDWWARVYLVLGDAERSA